MLNAPWCISAIPDSPTFQVASICIRPSRRLPSFSMSGESDKIVHKGDISGSGERSTFYRLSKSVSLCDSNRIRRIRHIWSIRWHPHHLSPGASAWHCSTAQINSNSRPLRNIFSFLPACPSQLGACRRCDEEYQSERSPDRWGNNKMYSGLPNTDTLLSMSVDSFFP